MRVTGLIASGAIADIGAPSTAALTAVVRTRPQLRKDGSKAEFLKQIADAVDASASPSIANFEDYLHAVETSQAIARGLDPHCGWPFKPSLIAFDPKVDEKWLDDFLLIQAEEAIIGTVGDEIIDYAKRFDPSSQPWFRDFWLQATQKCRWDLATTNYDDSIETCLDPDDWIDGYLPLDPGLRRFDAVALHQSGKTRLLHLHGSIYFGYPRFCDPNRFMFEDHFEDLYRYDDPAAARKTWFGRSTHDAQSHDVAIAGPIITGLRKSDKTLCYPYDQYQAAFRHATITSPRLLVAGYSFCDQHINHVIHRMTRLHKQDRRIVLVTFFSDPNKWWRDPRAMGWPDNHEMFQFIARSFSEQDPFPSDFRNPLVSKDGTTRIYLCGMKEALENHSEEILDFLTS